MTQSQLNDLLDQLGLKGFQRALQKQLSEPGYGDLGFEERLYHCLSAERSERDNRRIKRLLSLAKLKDQNASMESIEYGARRGLEKSVLLSLASNDYLSRQQNILITGATGVGKSFLAQALGKNAIHEGHSTRYTRIPQLLEEIKIARAAGHYTKTLSQLSRYKLLILDDFGITPLKNDEISDLFEVIEERTFSGSTIVTAQLPIKEWHAYLGNETIADAILDRLVHGSHKIELQGESMRKIKGDAAQSPV